MIGHIVWDWNGTVFGDSRALVNATVDAFAAGGLPQVTRSAYQRHHTPPIPAFYERLAGRSLSEEEQRRHGSAESGACSTTRVRTRCTPATTSPTPPCRSWRP